MSKPKRHKKPRPRAHYLCPTCIFCGVRTKTNTYGMQRTVYFCRPSQTNTYPGRVKCDYYREDLTKEKPNANTRTR